LKLHTDVNREDTFFYFTTCAWMMWNWLVSSLALGTAVLLFDGSPFHPDSGALFKLAQDEKITIFGTSARYLAELEKDWRKAHEIGSICPWWVPMSFTSSRKERLCCLCLSLASFGNKKFYCCS